jgi:GTPase involved in cell partitioning and DNA repair
MYTWWVFHRPVNRRAGGGKVYVPEGTFLASNNAQSVAKALAKHARSRNLRGEFIVESGGVGAYHLSVENERAPDNKIEVA